jgi:hypothetical protein
MSGQLQQHAFAAHAWLRRRSRVSPFDNRLGVFEDQRVLFLGRVVAGNAIATQQRKNFLLEIDWPVVLDLSDLNRLCLNECDGVELFNRKPERNDNSADRPWIHSKHLSGEVRWEETGGRRQAGDKIRRANQR